MENILFLVVLSSFFSGNVLAANADCNGQFEGHKVNLVVTAPSFLQINKGSSRLNVDDREVAQFYGSGLKQNFLTGRYKSVNNKGDSMEGKVINLKAGHIGVKKLSVPGYGILYTNFELRCGHNF